MGVSGRDAAFAQFVQDGCVVDVPVLTDSRQRPAEVVEVLASTEYLPQQREEVTPSRRCPAPLCVTHKPLAAFGLPTNQSVCGRLSIRPRSATHLVK